MKCANGSQGSRSRLFRRDEENIVDVEYCYDYIFGDHV